jgi:hypothetical protein
MGGLELVLRESGRADAPMVMGTNRGGAPKAAFTQYTRMFSAIEAPGSILEPTIIALLFALCIV